MGEYEFYGGKGITGATVQDRRRAFYGGPVAGKSTADLRRAWYLTQLGIPDGNYSVSDLEKLYYRSIGGSATASIDTLRSQYWAGSIAPVNPSEPGLLARFSFNDPGDTETFDSVANRRMALSAFTKVPGYDGQAINSTGMGIGDVGSSLLNRSAFTLAIRQKITSITATGAGGGVRLYAADGTTVVAQLLGRPQLVGSVNFSCIAQARFAGVNTTATRNAAISGTGLVADSYYWLFMEYDGATLATYVNDLLWNSVAAPGPPVDEATTSQTYVTGAGAFIDDVRFFDYALDSTKRLQLVGE